MKCILPKAARKTGFRHLVPTFLLMDDIANELYIVFWCGHSRDSNGYYYVIASWVPLPYSHYVMRSFPLCGVSVLQTAHYDLLDNHHGDRQKKNKKRHPGCLAHAVTGMFYSVVANQCQPQYTYNVLQRRCQPRPTIVYVVYILGELWFRGGRGLS